MVHAAIPVRTDVAARFARFLVRRRFAVAPLAFAVAILPLVAPPAAHAEDEREDSGLHLRIEDPNGGGLRLDLDGDSWIGGLVRAAVAEAVADCQSDLDADTRRLLRELDREGEGSRAELVEDGKRIQASRKDGQLLLVVDDRGERSRISVPWTFASCAMGGRLEIGDVLAREGELRIDIEGDDGGRVVVHID